MEKCVLCGCSVSEYTPVCKKCSADHEEAEELRDIANVLAITEGTDVNIKNAMESILNIANRLDGGEGGK